MKKPKQYPNEHGDARAPYRVVSYRISETGADLVYTRQVWYCNDLTNGTERYLDEIAALEGQHSRIMLQKGTGYSTGWLLSKILNITEL